jgi:Zn-dependent membrane protease YugP
MIAPKIALVAFLLVFALFAFPVGALRSSRRARRKYARVPLMRDLSGAQIAGLLLHREGLSRVAVEPGAPDFGERYAPVAGRIELAVETARGRSVYAAATAAFMVAKVTLHADADADFVRAHRRDFTLTVLANLLPPAVLAGLVIPGEGRAILFLVSPVLLCLVAGYTLFSLPAERHAARRALILLERHGIAGDKSERESLRACLAARATLCLAAPLSRCFWLNWAL